ncbi:kinase [Cryptosporidium sp. chipmunk genotype I]|uniref:kinase n=1 Tax=Cryptosporidium sp. chipmunk genotype I TaxID=1280935 RepID=UPI00351A1C3C|nr:kinase [Cryptosporidium sp. chipmunk genotype I]
MFRHNTRFFRILVITIINILLLLKAKENEKVCETREEEYKIGLRHQISFNTKKSQKNKYLNEEYNIISKDNDAYLLLFKMMDHDKQRILLLLSKEIDSGNLESNKDKDSESGIIIKKYSPRTWSKLDVNKLKELSLLGKNKQGNQTIWKKRLGNAQNKKLRELEYKTLNIDNNILRIDYTNRLLLEGVPDLNLLPYVESEYTASNELTLYKERSLIKITDGVLGLDYNNRINKLHSSYPDDKIKGLIRYFKFNKGSYGEVWRGLAFTEYLSEPFGNCGTEKSIENYHLYWRRGELVNHELNSLILDALDMLRKDFNKAKIVPNIPRNYYNQGDDGDVLDIVMKKMSHNFEESKIIYSVVREVFFGTILYCLPNVSRFLHIFEENIEDQETIKNSNVKSHIWLVYRYEGVSLGNLLFDIDDNGSLVPSEFWWKRVKATKGKSKGENVFREILHQILQGLNSAHSLGIIHRDIKPSNIFISQVKNESGRKSFYVRVGDWGSAMISDDDNLSQVIFAESSYKEIQEALYGRTGPTSGDETEGFQPPEVQFKSFGSENGENSRKLCYDVWSVGIVMLQMLWGNLQVFSVLDEDSEFQHILKRVIFHVKQLINEENNADVNHDELVADSVYRLSLMRLCLLDIREGNRGYSNKLDELVSGIIEKAVEKSMKNSFQDVMGITKRCSDEYFSDLIRKYDPSEVGLDSPEALDLIKKLLKPKYKERISIKEAITHPYFS